MKVRVLPSAKEDLRRGIAFYEDQQPRLGEYFLGSLSADIDLLQANAGIHPHSGGQYRCLSSRFPYWIYYRIQDQIVFITAILDARQEPGKIWDRIKPEEE